MNVIGTLLVSTLAVLISAYILPGVSVDTLTTALVVAALLGILNIFLKPFLILLTLPLTLLTFGLFTFVINVILIYLVDSLIPGFAVSGFVWALLFSLLLSLVTSLLNRVAK